MPPDSHAFDPDILRAYDVRGVVGRTLGESDAHALGRAFATRLRASAPAPKVCVGRDGRLTSPALEAALAAGLRAAGADVVRVGLGPTPMLHFAVRALAADGGVMVTGSHNPPGHNGFKMATRAGAFHGADIQALGRIAARGAFAAGRGAAEDRDVSGAYVDALAGAYRSRRELRVAWDAGNGAAGPIMARLAERLPGFHVLLCETVDGTFPEHHPDPTVPENLALLAGTVRGVGCDAGVAFDGDGDRLGAVDDRGRILRGDQLLCLLCEPVLAALPGATVIADVKASRVLFDRVAALGGAPLMWRTGHSPIRDKMAETGAPLAGEMSGHIFFADRYFGYDDGLYAAVRLLEAIAESGASASELRDRLPAAVGTPEIRFACPEARKFDVVAEAAARLARSGAEVCDVDGVRVTTPDGWWLLRASNTEAALVVRCEADDAAGLARLAAAVAAQLEASGVAPPAGIDRASGESDDAMATPAARNSSSARARDP